MKTNNFKIQSTRLFWIAFAILFICNTGTISAAQIWDDIASDHQLENMSAIKTRNHRMLQVNLDELRIQLNNAAREFSGAATTTLQIPLPDGSFETFEVYESPIMEAGLAEKFPGINTYTVQSVSHSNMNGRIDITHKGFHAILFTENGTVYIDPLNQNTSDVAISYYRHDYMAGSKISEASCTVIGEDSDMAKRISSLVRKGVSRPTGDELRTYRLAVAATGEYTGFHGGTVEDGLAAIVTSVNRVDGVYEREVAVRMILVADNDQIIYTSAFGDPFDNNSSGTLINQSQTVIDNVIGTANYDVGHVFSTGGGGLAQLGVPCNNNNKARGVTGIGAPIGDPFDIDYVAHELGHQFGAGHTFNGSTGSCGGNLGSNAYEPGSGTTIMAYAGICNPQNIQNNSDDYFHGASYDQIIAYTILSNGNSCAVITPTGNAAPEVGALEGGFIIPKETPFELTGNATDPDGDHLTFQWEQFDLGPQGAPNSPSGNAPIFRSFTSTSSTTRVFPQIDDVVSNSQTMGEILPTYARNLRFRFNARDNQTGGGGVDHDFISMSVNGDAGPFLVTAPNTADSYGVNSEVEVTWDVANTDVAPVNCQSVDVFLSTDGGFTYPTTLVSGTANDGSAMVTIPNEITTTARIKVKAVENVFFDISNEDFTITEPVDPDFYLNVPVHQAAVCAPADAVYDIAVEQLAGFSDAVLLEITNPPAGATVNFSNNNFVPTQNSTLTIGNTGALANGTYNLDLQVSGGSIVNNKTLVLDVFNGVPASISLASPADAAIAQGLQQTFMWTPDATAVNYDFELASDMAFTTVLATYSGAATSYIFPELLTPETTYYWRVKGNNTCGAGSFSSTFSFTTDDLSCTTINATDVPKIIFSNGAQTVSSTMTLTDDFLLADVNVLNLTGEHTWISDLDAYLTSPSGTIVDLFTGPCEDQNDFDINFDDEAASGVLPCPLTDGNTYQPIGSLADFYGENSIGDWVLTIDDNFNQDGGELSTWTLEVCQLGSGLISAPNTPSELVATPMSSSQIDLDWADNATDETGYVLERSVIMNTAYSEIASLGADVTSFSDMGLNNNSTYYYRVQAVKPTISSDYSNVASATTFDELSTPSTDLVATATSISTVIVTWTDNSNNESGFIVDRSVDDNTNYNTIDTVEADVVTYNDDGLNSGTIYYYKVAVYNAVGNSDYSAEDSALTDIESAVIDLELDNNTKLYPNPANDFVNLSIHQNSYGSLKLTLFDAAGKMMMEESFQKTEPVFFSTLDVSQLPDGLYLLKIELDDVMTIRKIQKHE